MNTQQNRRSVSPWNLVIHTRDGALASGLFECLSDFGRVRPSEHQGVFLLHADDPVAALHQLRLLRRINPAIDQAIERVVPLTETFTFASEQQLLERANRCIEQWTPRLAGKRVRLDHAQRLPEAECTDSATLGGILAGLLDKAGQVAGGSPELYLAFDCCGNWAGLSLWSRTLCRRYPELGFGEPEAAVA